MLRHARGFTLLEILVAFVVLAMVGGALLQLFQGGLRNIDSSAHVSHAALLAKSKLTELSASSGLSPGLRSGRFDDTYSWQLELSPYTLENGAPLPQSSLTALHAELQITWEPRGSYRVQTLLLAGGSL